MLWSGRFPGELQGSHHHDKMRFTMLLMLNKSKVLLPSGPYRICCLLQRCLLGVAGWASPALGVPWLLRLV